MSYNIITIPPFERQAKRLSKKFASFKSDLLIALTPIHKNPATGTPLGNNCYKIRLVISSKQKGKSGGARPITHFMVNNNTIVLLAVYDKSE